VIFFGLLLYDLLYLGFEDMPLDFDLKLISQQHSFLSLTKVIAQRLFGLI
jgi:hypothetical protein